MMAELAIWMAGGTTVAIFPTESADTVKYVLEHSGASLLFIGKLDTFASRRLAFRPACRALHCRWRPRPAHETWDSITAKDRAHRRQAGPRKPEDLALLMYTSGSTGTPKGVMHSFERATALQ
jgi:long-chain acyl-CoA synthetase